MIISPPSAVAQLLNYAKAVLLSGVLLEIFALSNALAILMEIRGVNLGRVNFKRRVWITYFCAKSYLELAAQNRLKIKQTVQRSIALTRSLQHPIFCKKCSHT